MNYMLYFIAIILLCIVIPSYKMRLYRIQRNKRKGVKRKMPKELIQEFIGKACSISLFNESFAIVGKIVAIEENWLKVETKREVQLINGDMIRNIAIMPEKYQK